MPSMQNLCKRKLLDYIINYVKSRKLHECDGTLFKNFGYGMMLLTLKGSAHSRALPPITSVILILELGVIIIIIITSSDDIQPSTLLLG